MSDTDYPGNRPAWMVYEIEQVKAALVQLTREEAARAARIQELEPLVAEFEELDRRHKRDVSAEAARRWLGELLVRQAMGEPLKRPRKEPSE